MERMCQVGPIKDLQSLSERLSQKHFGFDLLFEIQKRLDSSLRKPVKVDTKTTQAIAVALQCPPFLIDFESKYPAWKNTRYELIALKIWEQASYRFICREFGEKDLVYFHLSQENPNPVIHCIFVPIKSNKLAPQAFVGNAIREQRYANRYRAVLGGLFGLDRKIVARIWATCFKMSIENMKMIRVSCQENLHLSTCLTSGRT